MKKRIAFLIPQFYWGGMPHVASELIGLLEKKYDITLLLVNNKLDVRIDTHSAKVLRLQGGKVTKFISLWRLLRQKRFSTVVSFGVIDNLLNVLLTPKTTKRVITEHSTKSFDNEIEQHRLAKILYKIGLKYIYPHADSVVAVSYGIKDDLEKNYGLRNVKVIYNPLSVKSKPQKISSSDHALIDSIKRSNGKIVLNVGRLTTPKGQLSLVRSFKFLKDSNIHLVLIGEGPDYDRILRTVAKYRLQDSVHVIGTRNNVMAWMQQCDLYASLSWFEGFPGTLVEAVMNGLPVLSPDIYSGPREILSQGKILNYQDHLSLPLELQNGVLVDRFDFRLKDTDFALLERRFAKQIKRFIDYKDNGRYQPSVAFIDNSWIELQYTNLIEGKEEF